MVVLADGLRSFASRRAFAPISDAGFVPLPILEQAEQEDEAAQRARLQALSWEAPAADWRPIECGGIPAAPPRRFIDGSLASRTIGVIRVDGQRRPLVLAIVGALELRLEGDALRRPADGCDLQPVLCLAANGLDDDDLAALGAGCRELGIDLVARSSAAAGSDFDVLRRRAFDLAKDAMEERERRLLLRAPDVPALVDGLLERRLQTVASQAMPALGLVKRQMRQYLPTSHLDVLYDLAPGQRTPAFLLDTEHAQIVSWYLRLSTTELAGPSYGLVRLAMPLEYLSGRFPTPDERSAEISALSAWARALRHREGSYARVGVSLEPIVRVEDELHALMPRLDELAGRLLRALA